MCVDGAGKLTVNTDTHMLSLYCALVPDVFRWCWQADSEHWHSRAVTVLCTGA